MRVKVIGFLRIGPQSSNAVCCSNPIPSSYTLFFDGRLGSNAQAVSEGLLHFLMYTVTLTNHLLYGFVLKVRVGKGRY